jgi:hypothetical protein
LVADLTLRFAAARVSARVFWRRAAVDAPLPLLLLLTDREEPAPGERTDILARALCASAGLVVLAVSTPSSTDQPPPPEHDYELETLGWAAEHAAELDADPEDLLVAGEHVGGARAAWLAIRAIQSSWPELRRQILVHPVFTSAYPLPSPPAGVAAATVITSGCRSHDGHRYAHRLQQAGIDVDELCAPDPLRIDPATGVRSLANWHPSGRGRRSMDSIERTTGENWND